MSSSCTACSKPVSGRQHAIQCDTCLRWQHRLCGTGINIQDYRALSRGELSLDFVCVSCKNTTVESILGPLPTAYISPPQLRTSTPAKEFEEPIPPPHSPVVTSTPPPPSPECEPRSPTPPPSPEIEPRSPTPPPSPEIEPTSPTPPPHSVTYTVSTSFDVLLEINHHASMNESSLQERVEPDTVLEESAVSYKIVEQGTERSKLKLVSTDGYAYVFKKQTSKTTYWRCSVRRTNLCCKASISQRGDEFIPGSHPHIHPSDPGLIKKTKIYTDVKQAASKDPYKAAGHIVEEKMKTHIEENDFNLPNPMNLKRAANRCREKFRPPEPRDLQFAIDHKFLQDEEFFRGDLHVDVARHIMYASEAQLQVLESAKRWYLDGTFKVVADPFVQLFTIHAFVHKDDVMKQVPLLFVLMSRRQRKDYDAIFRHIQQLIPSHRVQSFVLDFEAATWRSLQDLFPMARIHGCSFHWGQAVMRKVAELGLKTTYYQRGYTYNYIRKVLSLPYLPASHTVPAFWMLQPGANTEPLSALMDYISHTWIDHSIWSVGEWSVFRQPIRTNNNTEGWHHRFAARAGGIHLQFYKLVPLLRSEADMVSISM